MGVLVGLGNAAVGGASLIANKQEQKRSREYNLKLAQMQNQWNVEQWQRENDYNSPVNQLKRLKEAGLNPDLVYGGGIQNTSASSPPMSSGAPSAPIDWSPMGNLVNSAVQAQLSADYMQAQIDNLNADTVNKGYEGSILASDASYRDAWNKGLLKTQNVQIELGNKDAALRDAQIATERKQLQVLDATIGQLSATTQQIYNAVKNDNARLDLEKAFNEAQIRKFASAENLDYAQADKIAKELEKALRNMDDVHEINVLNQGRLKIDNGRAEFEARMHGQGGYDKELSAFDNACRFITRLTDAALGSIMK